MIRLAAAAMVMLAVGCHSTPATPQRGASRQPIGPGVPVERLVATLQTIEGARPLPWHHFTIARDGHEYVGMSFSCMSGRFFLLARDRELAWVIGFPEDEHDETEEDADSLMNWALDYQGPTYAEGDVEAYCAEGVAIRRSRETNPVFYVLMPLILVDVLKEAEQYRRFVRSMEELGPLRFRIGMSIEEVKAMLPPPKSVREGTGWSQLVFGDDFKPDLLYPPAPRMIVLARGGRIEQIMTVYRPNEYDVKLRKEHPERYKKQPH